MQMVGSLGRHMAGLPPRDEVAVDESGAGAGGDPGTPAAVVGAEGKQLGGGAGGGGGGGGKGKKKKGKR